MNRALEFSLVQKIRKRAKPLVNVSAEELRKSGLSLKYRASVGEPIEKLIPEAFPLVIEAIRRSMDMVPYDVQIFAAMQIAKGRIAEMKTGEGKTLTATMPARRHQRHFAARTKTFVPQRHHVWYSERVWFRLPAGSTCPFNRSVTVTAAASGTEFRFGR